MSVVIKAPVNNNRHALIMFLRQDLLCDRQTQKMFLPFRKVDKIQG